MIMSGERLINPTISNNDICNILNVIVYNDTGFKKLDNSNLTQKYYLIYNYVLVNYSLKKFAK